MRHLAGAHFFLATAALCSAQSVPRDISAPQLQTLLDLPLTQAVVRREIFKGPLKQAYGRQMDLVNKDCQAESEQGQQPYNICMGGAERRANSDYAVFYDNLQMLCHSQAELAALQAFEKQWRAYKTSALQTARVTWPDVTGAPGSTVQVELTVLRNHMRELNEIYGLNIAQ